MANGEWRTEDGGCAGLEREGLGGCELLGEASQDQKRLKGGVADRDNTEKS